jgi:hypothetical protein
MSDILTVARESLEHLIRRGTVARAGDAERLAHAVIDMGTALGEIRAWCDKNGWEKPDDCLAHINELASAALEGKADEGGKK